MYINIDTVKLLSVKVQPAMLGKVQKLKLIDILNIDILNHVHVN